MCVCVQILLHYSPGDAQVNVLVSVCVYVREGGRDWCQLCVQVMDGCVVYV